MNCPHRTYRKRRTRALTVFTCSQFKSSYHVAKVPCFLQLQTHYVLPEILRKQVLRRTNRLISFGTTGAAYKATSPTILVVAGTSYLAEIRKYTDEVEVILTADGRSARLFWCQTTITARDQFFFLLDIFFGWLRVCYFVASSLMRGRVCDLLLLLGLSITAPLRSEFSGTQNHILFSQFFKLPQSGGPGPLIYILQEQGGSVIPPSTTVEVF
jgi:hypothetical protein